MADRLPDWDAAAAALDGILGSAWPAGGRAVLLGQDPRAPLGVLEEAAQHLTASADPCAAARADDAALRSAAVLAAQAALYAAWGAEGRRPPAGTELLGAAPASLVGTVGAGTTTLGGLVSRYEAHRSAWRGEAPAYVDRLAQVATEVATALAALRLADRWPG